MADSDTRALAIRPSLVTAAGSAQVSGQAAVVAFAIAKHSGGPARPGLGRTRSFSSRALRPLSARLLNEALDASVTCSADVLEAAEYSFVELGERLCRLVGPNGYRALVARAIHIAAAEFPLLGAVRPGISPPGRLVGWHRRARRSSVHEVRNAAEATLAALLWLLEQFIGPDLTQRVLVEIWPWLSSSAAWSHGPRRLTGS